ncbi:hypothetical protein [Echinicola rosea]|uniref:hypothetical protein n=1 Tax=Echinicola rosea TaxID=1807691 RepID=UPI0010CA71ED|nr:hypothetical protein [Echinicola rosea]
MGSIFFPWAVIFLAKSLGGFHPFTFVTFLLQVKKVTQKIPPLRHGAQVCSYWPKIKTFPHAGKLLLFSCQHFFWSVFRQTSLPFCPPAF